MFSVWILSIEWMFHSRKVNNHINSFREHALGVVYKDYNPTFSELLSKDKLLTIHQRNLQLLATEIFITKTEMNPILVYNLRNNASLKKSEIFTLIRGRDMTRKYSQMHRTYKYLGHNSIIWPVWPNG